MSTFDIQLDAPNLLRAESLNITLNFARTGPNTGRISWNIPTPAAGCSSTSQSYCGMLLTIDNTPVTASKLPTNGNIYTSDPTADQNLFAGDKIGTSLIVGAFYNDITTTFMDVTGLQPNTPYYVSGFPMDCQYRFFTEGVHAYSLDSTNKGQSGSNGSQKVILNHGNGVTPTDYTGLQPTIDYSFNIQIGTVPKPTVPVYQYDCPTTAPVYTIHVNGTNAATYQQLILEINKQLSLIDNPYQGPDAPNTGAIYWDVNTHSLYTWNGTTNIPTPVIIQSNNPVTVTSGSYWYDNTHLHLRNITNTWDIVPFISSSFNPQSPIANTSFWFNGTQGYIWNGVTWCTVNTIIQNTDPSIAPIITPGSYWYDTLTAVLYKWDNSMGMWTNTIAIKSATDPNSLIAGTYWFNTTNNILYIKDTPSVGWNQVINALITTTTPTTPAVNTIWYNPNTELLKQYNGTTWIAITPIITSSVNPIQRQSCDLWWNTTTNELLSWDILNSVWKQVVHFYIQDTDPTIAPTIAHNTLWFNSTTNLIQGWLTNCFTIIDVIQSATDPTILTTGEVWHNLSNNLWYEYNGTSWVEIFPTIMATDPTLMSNGTLWYNSSNNSLQVWNGLNWVSITFYTTSRAPSKGTLWFNTNTNTLVEWNGFTWVNATPKAIVEGDCNGNLLFTDTTPGSLSCIVLGDVTLFQSLTNGYQFGTSLIGQDEVTNQPTWSEMGVGTDGSKDERMLLANQIRYDLGYPVIDVELTHEQLDYAITKTLSELRSKSGLGYKNGYFFLETIPEHSKYTLSNRNTGENKIVDILSIQRVNSLASGGHDSGIYGQIFANFLYNAGNFDLLSYHLMTEYKKTYEIIFAQRIQWNWTESTRELYLHQRMPYRMLLAIECTVERTEQDIMNDRLCNPWVRRYATAQARLMLAEIRGKYSTLPGAGGGVTLNANDLRMAAKEEMEACLNEIDNFLVDNPNEWGMSSSFLFG